MRTKHYIIIAVILLAIKAIHDNDSPYNNKKCVYLRYGHAHCKGGVYGR